MEAGKILRWGVSNLDTDDLAELGPGDAAANQVLYNLEARGIEFDLLPWCAEHRLPVMAYSPVGQGGALLDHPAMAQVASRHGATAAQVAIAWSIRSPGVISIPKASDPAHVRDNAAAASLGADGRGPRHDRRGLCPTPETPAARDAVMVASIGLPAMMGVLIALALLSAAGRWLPPRATAPATAGLCLLALCLALVLIAAGGQAQLLGGGLAVDALAAFFLLLPALAGLVGACGWLGGAAPASLPGYVATALLVVLAGDARMLLLAVALFLLAGDGWRLRLPVLAGLFLLGFVFVAAGHGSASGFGGIRAAPPDGWRAALVLLLLLLALASVVGWGRPLPAADTPTLPVAVLGPVIGQYLAIRVLLDLCGPATPGWWALPLLLAGAASAGLGVTAALRAPEFRGVLAGLAMQGGGWMLAGLGVAAAARSADLLPLATLALGGTMLYALNYTVFASLAALSTETAAIAAGSQTLDRLGGLTARMPAVALGMLVSGLSLALLPPSAGFASGWMVLQALFGAPRAGGLSLQLTVAATVAVLGLSAGLGAAAVVRMGGMAFLGRPRTPRAAAADQASAARRGTVLGLIGVCGLLGVFPGFALQLTGAAQRLVTAAGLDRQGGWAGLRIQLDSPGYVPLGVTLLLALGFTVAMVLLRRGTLPGSEAVAAWEDGYTAPPAWMPFGDPATQITAASLAAITPAASVALPAMPRLRLRVEAAWPAIGPRHAIAFVLALAVLLLVIIAVLGPA